MGNREWEMGIGKKELRSVTRTPRRGRQAFGDCGMVNRIGGEGDGDWEEAKGS